MSYVRFKERIDEILDLADVKTNGERPWDITVSNNDFYRRVLSEGTLGFGEAYMEGWWDTHDMPELIYRILKANLSEKVKTFGVVKSVITAKLINRQRKSKAFEVGEKHYDIGNDLYQAMLDKRMVYTCGYWKNATNLDEAQEHKLDLVCRKMGLKPGMRVLDIGCGWGSFLRYAAEVYGVELVGVTVSKEQKELGQKICEGLPVEIHLQDYRDIQGRFDRIISLGMFEHVGYKNYRTYMEVAHRCLKDGGQFLLHTIGGNTSVKTISPWMDRYIFPNAMLPSIQQISAAFEGLFVMEDWHNFGADYEKTLMAWFHNFHEHWSTLKDHYSEEFYRMWKYYLLSCAGSFRARENQLWQIVLSKGGVPGGYIPIR